MNQKLKEKFEMFDDIDKLSNENTKQTSYKTKDINTINEAVNNSINHTINLINMDCLNNINRNDKFNKTFHTNKNKKIENLKGKFSKKLDKKLLASKEQSQEKNPEKFVFQFFYEDPQLPTKYKQSKTSEHNNSNRKNKNRLKSNELGSQKIKYFRQNGNNSKDSHNLSFNHINNQLNNYRAMVTKFHNEENKGNNKSKENNNKINKLITKLYNDGLQQKRKKEFKYKENLLKKEEEYKKYSFQPNNHKRKKNKTNKNKSIKINKINENLYSKQIEWKNQKEKVNSQKRKEEEELYMSQFTFKPNISQDYIADDEKMIRRNMDDMNNYILKRRNQIRYKKEEGFKLRNYKQINYNIYNNNKEPFTERIFYRNREKLNNSLITTTKIQFNYSKNDFLMAVKNLHNEISNLNL